MYLSDKDVCDLASYTRIALTPQEAAAMTADLNSIIEGLAPITQFDLEDVEPSFHVLTGLVNAMRKDEVAPGLERSLALQNAPAHKEGMFEIPTILGDGGDS